MPLAPARPFSRRRTLEALGVLGAVGTLSLLGCGGGEDDSSDNVLALAGTARSCAPLADDAIYVWHCTADGVGFAFEP